jgi:hypothetical protein
MSYEHYARVRHGRPYVLDVRLGQGRLIYFGIGHTYRPADPQLAIAERFWSELQPSQAFNEGGTPARGTSKEEVKRRGEPAFLRALADRDGVAIESLDPTRQQEIAELSKHFPPAHLKAFTVLRWLSEYRRRRPEEQTETAERVVSLGLTRASIVKGLQGKPNTLEELEGMLPEIPGLRGTWRDANEKWFDPGRGGAGTGFNRIATASSQFRDQFMITRLVQELRAGKTIFALMGASHVVMQEPALRAALPEATWIRRMG